MTTEERESKSAGGRRDNLGKNAGLDNTEKPNDPICKKPESCQMSYYTQIDNYYCSMCDKTGLTTNN